MARLYPPGRFRRALDLSDQDFAFTLELLDATVSERPYRATEACERP